jgi:hypothetical protein
MLYLRHRYRRDVDRSGCLPPHRAALDRVVEGDAILMVSFALAVCAAFALHPIHATHWLVVSGESSRVFALGWTVVYASSLVDWYLILPRVSGQLGHRPCRAADEVAEFSFPSTWREVTRWWYIHRVVAAISFRFGLSTAIATAAAALTGVELLGKGVALIVMLSFGAYAFTAAIQGFREAKQVGQGGHTKGAVGQTVKVERRPRRRSLLRPWYEPPPLAIEGRHYVVDVALESVQLARVESREAEILPDPIRFERDFDSVPLADVDALRQEEEKFSGCRERCSGINWYCIENSRCYRPK